MHSCLLSSMLTLSLIFVAIDRMEGDDADVDVDEDAAARRGRHGERPRHAAATKDSCHAEDTVPYMADSNKADV